MSQTAQRMTGAQMDDAIEVVGMARKKMLAAQITAAQAEDDYRAGSIEAQDMVEAETAWKVADGHYAGMLDFMTRVYGLQTSNDVALLVEDRG